MSILQSEIEIATQKVLAWLKIPWCPLFGILPYIPDLPPSNELSMCFELISKSRIFWNIYVAYPIFSSETYETLNYPSYDDVQRDYKSRYNLPAPSLDKQDSSSLLVADAKARREATKGVGAKGGTGSILPLTAWEFEIMRNVASNWPVILNDVFYGKNASTSAYNAVKQVCKNTITNLSDIKALSLLAILSARSALKGMIHNGLDNENLLLLSSSKMFYEEASLREREERETKNRKQIIIAEKKVEEAKPYINTYKPVKEKQTEAARLKWKENFELITKICEQLALEKKNEAEREGNEITNHSVMIDIRIELEKNTPEIIKAKSSLPQWKRGEKKKTRQRMIPVEDRTVCDNFIRKAIKDIIPPRK